MFFYFEEGNGVAYGGLFIDMSPPTKIQRILSSNSNLHEKTNPAIPLPNFSPRIGSIQTLQTAPPSPDGDSPTTPRLAQPRLHDARLPHAFPSPDARTGFSAPVHLRPHHQYGLLPRRPRPADPLLLRQARPGLSCALLEYWRHGGGPVRFWLD